MFEEFFKKSLFKRLLALTTVLLALAIVGISVALVWVQKDQLTKLNQSILYSLEKLNAATENNFVRMGKDVDSNLKEMSRAAGETITANSRVAMKNEREAIEKDWESMLRNNAEFIAELLARVSPGAILANNFLDLISYAKSADQNPDIVYAIFLKPDGKPFVRYIDRKDPVITDYLKTGKGKLKIDKVIDASQKDEKVFILEKQIALEGQELGKVLLCVNKSSLKTKTKEMSSRFSSLVEDNAFQVQNVLDVESGKISSRMQNMLSTFKSGSAEATAKISGEISESGAAVQSKIQFVSILLGGGSIVIVFVFLFLILTLISKALLRMVGNLNRGAQSVSSASNQISSASRQLAEGSGQQAAFLQQTSSSLEEMSSMTRQNAENAAQADQLMRQANQVVEQANRSMRELTSSMKSISDASDETSKIIKTIDEIAFQTNLLALNAAVEAARAGAAGAGFAVVAGEVRTLAMRAADAARNTAELIDGSSDKITNGMKLVNRTNEAFSEVASGTTKVAALIAEIAAASGEQANGIEQVNTATSEMDKVTQQNAAMAQESSSASEEMRMLARKMNTLVRELSTLVGGNGHSPKTESFARADYPMIANRGRKLLELQRTTDTKEKAVLEDRSNTLRPERLIPMKEEDLRDF